MKLLKRIFCIADYSGSSLLVSISEVVLGNILAAFISQVEIEEDACAFPDLTPDSHHGQVDIIAVDWIPLGVELQDALERSIEVEIAHVEILDHL